MSRAFTNCRFRLWGVFRFGPLALTACQFLAGSSEAHSAERVLQNWLRQPQCVEWDGQAAQAIVSKVSGANLDLQRLGEDLFRMRRARRLCDLGMARTACEEYAAIVRDIGGTSSDWRRAGGACPPAVASEPVGEGRRTVVGSE